MNNERRKQQAVLSFPKCVDCTVQYRGYSNQSGYYRLQKMVFKYKRIQWELQLSVLFERTVDFYAESIR